MHAHRGGTRYLWIAFAFGLLAACGGRSVERVTRDGGGPPTHVGGGASGSEAGAGTGNGGACGSGRFDDDGDPSRNGTSSSDAVCGAAFGTSYDDLAYDIALDANGNVHVAASTFGSLSGTNAGGRDGCARKYDSTGTHQWTEQFGTPANDMGVAVAVDASGNVYVAGYTDGSLGGASEGGGDGYVRKVDSTGTHQWSEQLGTSAADYTFAAAVDASESVYVAGHTAGALDGTNAGNHDGYVRKYDSGGAHQWTAQFGTSDIDQAYAIAVDASANVYVAGHTSGALDGTNAGGYDGYLGKYDSGGAHQWTAQFGTSDNDFGQGVAVDSNGNVYVAGFTQGSLANTNAGNDDAYLRKYDSGGVHQWTAQFGTSAEDRAQAVAVDSSGSVYVAGSTHGSLAGMSAGDSDGYVRSYASDGTHQWTEQFGTPDIDAGYAVAVDANGDVYVAGSTRGSLVGTDAGGFDGFVIQIPGR